MQALPQVASGPTGYTPQQIQTAYGLNQITFSGGKVVGNGAGQTIAIVNAYNDPNITSDLATFDSEFGLSAPPSFTVDNLGATTTNAGLGAGDVARRRVGPRHRSRGQHRSGRGRFDHASPTLVQRGQLRQQTTGCQRGLDELGDERVLG